jgi:hypothetical protein
VLVLEPGELIAQLAQDAVGVDFVFLESGLALEVFELTRFDIAPLFSLNENEILAKDRRSPYRLPLAKLSFLK